MGTKHGTSVEGRSHPSTKGCITKVFVFFNYHTCVDGLFYLLQILFLCYSYFSSLQVKNKPYDKDLKHAFIPGPIFFSLDAYINIVCSCQR